MKKSHRDILSKIESYLSQPGAEHLRFWQAMRNCNIIEYEDIEHDFGMEYRVVDDYNISDEALLKRISNV